jgi:hypothetical protein
LEVIFKFRFNSENLDDNIEKINNLFLLANPDDFIFFLNTLAFGYFADFISAICSKIVCDGNLELDEIEYSSWNFENIIASKIEDDINLQFDRIKNKIVVKENVINC